MSVAEIRGHPALEAITASGREMKITVCAECGEMRTILFLARDRWFCTRCRAEGDARPTRVPLQRPTRR